MSKYSVEDKKNKGSSELKAVEKMISEEMFKMMVNDNYKYPFKGMKKVENLIAMEDKFNVQELERARKLVDDETDHTQLNKVN